ncbi:MAG: SAF domain-containing protein [Clostridia bacterium]|nr:SAF domain-containing protein [Clostridia bacterium]
MMPSNPMQRKTRNAFLLGVTVTLLVAGVVIVLLFLMLKQKNDQLVAEQAAKINVYTLTQDVKAGQILTEDMFSLQQVNRDTVPSNATATFEVIDSWFLQTKEGEPINTGKYGLYLDKGDTIIEVIENTGNQFEDSKGNKVATGDYYVDVNGTLEKVKTTEGVTQDENGMFFVDTQGNDQITRVYQENSTGEFYIYKLDTSTLNTGAKARVKQYIEIKNVPVLAKVNMNMNTVITPQFIVQSDEIITDDVRQQQYNMLVLPMDLMTNDYIDIRLMSPGGQDFIVVSKVQVDIPLNADGTYVTDTIRVNLREDEILSMSSAIVEAYGLAGSKLYVTKYVDPANQEAALPTYVPNASVTAQIQSNPNVVEIAKQELATRYTEAAKNLRNNYLQGLINNETNYFDNIKSSMDEEIGNSISTRQEYLESLNY